MRNNHFFPIGILLTGTLLAGSACSFKLNVPPGQVLCKQNSDCPSGATCEAISQDAAPITVSVCCLKPGCTANLPSDIVSAAVAAAYQPPQDGSASEVSVAAEVGISADAQAGPEAQASRDLGVGHEAQSTPDAVPAPDVQTSPDVIVAPDVLTVSDAFLYPDVLLSSPDVGFRPEAQVALDASPSTDVSLAMELGGKQDVGTDVSLAMDLGGKQDVGKDGPIGAEKSGAGQGANCTLNSDCANGNCVDGFCCDSACNGTCQSCANKDTTQPNGTCASILAGQDPNAECPKDLPASGCGRSGGCDGTKAACAMYGTETTCAAPHCQNNTYFSLWRCNGNGGCTDSIGVLCSPFLGCTDGIGCKSTCSSDGDCVSGYHCNIPLQQCQ